MKAQKRLHRPARRRGAIGASERGTVSLVFVTALLVLIGFIGLALDLGMFYNRKVELIGVSRYAALAAARELNGTAEGVDRAAAAANATVQRLRYKYNSVAFEWSDAALQLSPMAPPNANWVDVATARAKPGAVFFVRVATAGLRVPAGTLETVFIRVLSESLRTVSLSDAAVAGRTATDVLPLGVCALSPIAAAPRSNAGGPGADELVEFGFRRGVGYDLMQLNPNGSSAVNYVIDPISMQGSPGVPGNVGMSVIRPFICTGKMWIVPAAGTSVRVTSPFPIGMLYNDLNSRFDLYAGQCKPGGAPPDANVRQFSYDTAAPWMATTPAGQSATRSVIGNKLSTVADPLPAPATNTAASYGPLWAFAKAVPYAAFAATNLEPATGYGAFSTSAWANLYQPGAPAAVDYPASAQADRPYLATSGSNFLAPASNHRLLASRNRRVLNVPLLACPVAAGANIAATVMGIGRFFMTVPATATALNVEFAGLLSGQATGGTVELYQ